LRTMGRIIDPKEFNDLVVATRNGSPIRVRDLGWSEDGTKEQRSVALLNGEPTVTLEIRRQSGANTVAVIEGLKAKIPPIAAQLPADVSLVVIRDQSRNTLSWAASWPAWWWWRSCGTGARWSSPAWPFPPPSSPRSA
jgi:HAE1 family hydrophobic/amphiphilic exporter-1